MKTCFTASELFMTSHLIVPCSLCSFKWKYHVYASLGFLSSISEHLSLFGSFSATFCVFKSVTPEPFCGTQGTQGMEGSSSREGNLEAFANINCSHFPEILDAIFNSNILQISSLGWNK